MALETATYIHQLNTANPSGADRINQGDDHIRLLKAALKATFPSLTGAVNLDQAFLNRLPDLVVPTGVIAPFFGDTAPTGWAICNGQTVSKSDGSGTLVTPDLRGRTILGASDAFAINQGHGQQSKTVTTTAAGGHTHSATASAAGGHSHGGATGATSLSVDQLPAHSHLMAKNGVSNATLTSSTALSQERTAGGDTQYVLMGNEAEPDVGKTSTVGSGNSHSHSIASEADHTHAISVSTDAGHAHQATVDVLQPSYALHWIMKI